MLCYVMLCYTVGALSKDRDRGPRRFGRVCKPRQRRQGSRSKGGGAEVLYKTKKPYNKQTIIQISRCLTQQ